MSMEAMITSSSVTDLSTEASLVQGSNKDNIYEWSLASQITQPTVHSSIVVLKEPKGFYRGLTLLDLYRGLALLGLRPQG
ncbi:hypothetical protein BHE74_00046711 [Ensete ventricosum]|nr:hypothetical protein BHE74_00046711 [Ensete ventricosum]RZS11359.1 hypothetical protein BHM03_00042679 [Ensete ventricosum]